MKPLLPLLALLLHAAAASGLEIIAHRGASFDAPENTVASFRLGWEQGADADELDIYLSKDRQVVVMHDATTRRTAGADRPIADQTLDELRALDAGAWKGPRWAGEKIPTLAEALATMPAGRRFFIEIKGGPDLLPELEKVLAASGRPPAQLAIIGFSYETVRDAKARFPQIPTYWLVAPRKETAGREPAAAELIDRARAAHLDGLDLDHAFALDPPFVAAVKAAGLQLYVWTVDDPALARRLAALGIDGITTNRPRWLRDQLK